MIMNHFASDSRMRLSSAEVEFGVSSFFLATLIELASCSLLFLPREEDCVWSTEATCLLLNVKTVFAFSFPLC